MKQLFITIFLFLSFVVGSYGQGLEFITMIIHPYIEKWTHHAPIYMLITLVGLAAILVPLHHKLGHWVNEKLIHKKHLEK